LFTGVREVRQAEEDLVILSGYEILHPDGVETARQDSEFSYYPGYLSCQVVLLDSPTPNLLLELTSCPSSQAIALSTKGVYVADGFEGIRFEAWTLSP
jgi:hypothetical protein